MRSPAADRLSTALVGGIVLCLSSLAATAQRFAVIATPLTSAPRIHEIDETGTVLSTFATLPQFMLPNGMTMAEDNRTLLVTGADVGLTPSEGVVLRIDRGMTTTIVRSPVLRSPDVALHTADGDWIVLDTGPGLGDTIYRVDQGSARPLCTVVGEIYGAALDPATGLLVARGRLGSPPRGGLFAIDTSDGTVASLWIAPTPRYDPTFGARELFVDHRTSGVVDFSFDAVATTAALTRVANGQSTPVGPALSMTPVAVTRSPSDVDPNRYAVLSSPPLRTPEIVRLDKDGRLRSRALIGSIPLFARSPLVAMRGRALSWTTLAGPNDRVLTIDLPNMAGHDYLVGMGLSGVRPGITFGQNRHLPINVDALTVLCLNGGIAGTLGPTTGQLGASGRTAVQIDASGLGASIRGVTAWVVVVVLDPGAPDSISHVLGPERIDFK